MGPRQSLQCAMLGGVDDSVLCHGSGVDKQHGRCKEDEASLLK